MNAFRFGSLFDWSTRVGSLFGIPIRLHFTILFFLLPALNGGRALGFGHAVEYVLGVVLSILLHELGHALTAKAYGMTGLSITLHGFGGFATSSGFRSPRQALVIALAGPAATFAWAAICSATGALGTHAVPFGTEAWIQFALLGVLGTVNFLLGILNLIPVLPWDGGQALQAALAHRMSNFKAMRAAAHLGLILAPPLLVYGFLSDRSFFGLFGLVGLLTCYTTLAGSGGIRLGEVFADQRAKREVAAVKRREQARQADYVEEVKDRERERVERERLRKLLEGD